MDNTSDKVVYHYVCRNLNLFEKIKDKWFDNIMVSKLFKLSKSFYENYHTLIFDINKPSTVQIENYARSHPELVETDAILTKEENITLFLSSVAIIIEHDYSQYSKSYTDDVANGFVEWKSFQDGLRQAVEYQKITKVDGTTEMRAMVSKCKDIIMKGASVRLDNDLGVDFFDPEAHIQPPPTDNMNSGFSMVNDWLCGNSSGGFEKGTTSLFISLPNVGKCEAYMSIIKIRNKTTGCIMDIPVGEFHELIKKSRV